jgi:hypothetical protein
VELLLTHCLPNFCQNFVEVDVMRVNVDSQVRQDEVELRRPLVLQMLVKLVLENRVHEDIVPVEPIFLRPLQAPQDKMLHGLADLYLCGEGDLPRHDFIPKALLALHQEIPGNPADQHFVGHHSQRPNVAFERVFLFVKNLGSHVVGSPH